MLTLNEINHLAALSRLELSEAEKENLAADLSSILEYVQKLQSLDTSAVEPMNGGTLEVNIMRPDVIIKEWEESKSLRREKLLNAMPDRNGDYLKVPPVFI